MYMHFNSSATESFVNNLCVAVIIVYESQTYDFELVQCNDIRSRESRSQNCCKTFVTFEY